MCTCRYVCACARVRMYARARVFVATCARVRMVPTDGRTYLFIYLNLFHVN